MPSPTHQPLSPTPSLYRSPFDKSRESSASASNPSTPKLTVANCVQASHKNENAANLYFSWHKKQDLRRNNDNGSHDNVSVFINDFEGDLVDPLFEGEGNAVGFPLFPSRQSPPPLAATTMAASPVDIQLPPRLSSSQSPRNQTSNLTSALQEAGASAQHVPPEASNAPFMGVPEPGRLSVSGRHDSISGMFGPSSYYGSGARPIATRDRQRRESNTAGSFMNGMSWGGISVGSLRDDIMMTGTSPMPFGRSPSIHSASYLPKMEAQFLSGYNCCGQKLDTLHDLLQHFEENHAQQSGQIAQRSSVSSQAGFPTNRRPSASVANGDGPRTVTSLDQRNMGQRQNSFAMSRDGFNRTQLSTVQDMDTLEDMEMDDTTTPATLVPPQTSSPVQNQTPTMTPLNTAVPPSISTGQAFRTSTPSTPNAAQAFQLYSNPTVSSVNTPALGTQPFSSTQSPHTSMPGTPAEPNPEFNNDFMASMGFGGMNGFGAIPLQTTQMMGEEFDFSTIGFGLANNMSEMTIDDPAKRLFSKAGSMNPQQLAYALKTGQMSMDSELQKKLREQQLVAGLGGPVIGLSNFPDQENKPFKCPVIGCEKAYKNQNGLKYHKQHGHNNQKLQENADGTFSIVDPITSIPYPGNIGMEKEKPYQCPVCGKRYKNLNGLKYHKQHSAMCNPDLKAPGAGPLAGLSPSANVAGNMF